MKRTKSTFGELVKLSSQCMALPSLPSISFQKEVWDNLRLPGCMGIEIVSNPPSPYDINVLSRDLKAKKPTPLAVALKISELICDAHPANFIWKTRV